MLRYTFLALAVFAFTISLLIPSGDAAAQGCPPGGGDEMDVANVKYTKDPASLQNVRGIVFDVRWENCTGIDRVEARVIDKATGKQLAAPYFKTIDVTATKSNWQIQLPMSKQNDWVQVTVYALDSTGAEIAKSPTKEVKLLK